MTHEPPRECFALLESVTAGAQVRHVAKGYNMCSISRAVNDLDGLLLLVFFSRDLVAVTI